MRPAALLSWLFWTLPGCGPALEVPGPPNVLLVSIDTLRADRLGAYGYELAETPRIDALARSGTRFATAISPAPLTLPSHATLLTGLDPVSHGVRHNGVFRLPESRMTLAERLHEAGYATGAVVSSSVLAARYGLSQGFDSYQDDVVMDEQRVARGGEQLDAARVSDKALAWLTGAREPFFLFVHYYDPHASYRPPAPFDARFADRPYDGEIAYVDQQLGRVLDALEASGRSGRTWVVVTADHGESLGEHGETTHAYSIYDATQHVPLLVRGPGVPAGRVVEGVVRLADVAPTLLAGAGLAAASEADGEDLAPLWRDGAEPSSRTAYAETLATEIDHGWSPLHALRTDSQLYIRAPRPELYDVRRDPAQLDDRGSGAESAQALAAALEARLAATGAAEALVPDDETRRQLQALGYALPADAPPRTGLDPKDGLHALARYHEAEAANHAGRFVEGEAILTALVAEQPRSASFRSALAATYLAMGRPADALPHARLAAEWVPRSASYWGMLSRVHAALGQVDRAIEASDRALAIDDSDETLLLDRMEVAARGGRHDEAADFGRRARSVDPTNVAIARRVADMYESTGRSDEALAAYRSVLELDPQSYRDHMHLAVHLARLGRLEQSERHRELAGAVARDPLARRMLARALLDGGAPERALPLYRALLAETPQDDGLRQELARTAAAAGDGPPARVAP